MRVLGHLIVASLVVLTATAGTATAAITVTPGADTVATSRIELDFGDAGGNIERLDGVRWRDSGGTLGANLSASSGAGGCDAPAALPFTWGEAGSLAGAPQPVGSGSAGTWTPRGRRSVEIASSRSLACTGDTTITPVRTRYTFFDAGGAANKVRVERTLSFSPLTPNYVTTSVRAYVTRLPYPAYSQVVHPNSAGNDLQKDAAQSPYQSETNWNQKWIAINNPATNAGVVLLRETSSLAQIVLDNDGGVTSASAIDLVKPLGGWAAPLTETEWLCFYDAASWPVGQRSATNLPSQCAIVPVPINTAPPVISGETKVGTPVSASQGTWDASASLAFQWLRCAAGVCTAIPGATAASYTPGDADEGKQMRFDVTSTATGGETDIASSALTDGVKSGPPQSTGLPLVSGEARQDEVLTGTIGNWSGTPTSYQYQWLRCAAADGTGCADVAGATATTYKLVAADVGATMRFRVRAVNSLGPSLAADSAPTVVIQRMVIRATLAVAPNPSCTGIATTFDGSASKTPNGPIVRYRLTYQEYPLGLFFAEALVGGGVIDRFLAKAPTYTLYDGANPSPSVTFTWNRQLLAPELSGKLGDYVRDVALVTLTVTDRAGATASADENIGFGQTYSNEARNKCPKLRVRLTAYAFAKVTGVAFAKATALSPAKSAFSVKVPCATVIDCAGSLAVTAVSATDTLRAFRAKAVVLARNRFFRVRGKQRGTVLAKLTKAGRSLVKRGTPLAVRVQLTSIDPATGRKTTRSTLTTLSAAAKR